MVNYSGKDFTCCRNLTKTSRKFSFTDMNLYLIKNLPEIFLPYAGTRRDLPKASRHRQEGFGNIRNDLAAGGAIPGTSEGLLP